MHNIGTYAPRCHNWQKTLRARINSADGKSRTHVRSGRSAILTLTSADAPAGSTRPPSHADKSRRSPGPGGEKEGGGYVRQMELAMTEFQADKNL